MKVLFQLAIGAMRQEKTRSFLYSIGLFFSVFFITSLMILMQASENFQIKQELYLNDDYDISYTESDHEQVVNDIVSGQVERQVIVYDIGIVKDKAQIIEVSAFDRPYEGMLFSLQKGHYPENEHEILVSNYYLQRHQLHLGDEITIKLYDYDSGVRKTSYQVSQENTYQISGVVRGSEGNEYASQTRDRMYTYLEHPDKAYGYRSYITLKKTSLEETNRILDQFRQNIIIDGKPVIPTVIINELSSQIRYGEYIPMVHTPYQIAFYMILAIMVLMVTNMTFISLKKKEQYIGMLKSVGTDSKQLILLNFMEAFLIMLLIIPLALCLSYGVMFIFLQYLTSLENFDMAPFPYSLSSTISAIPAIILLNLILVLFCHFLALYRVKGKSVISLLKQEEKEHKRVFKQKYKGIFKSIEILIAKRNRKRNRFAIASIQLSIVLSIFALISGNYIFKTIPEQTIQRALSTSAVISAISFMFILISICNLLFMISSNIENRKKEYVVLMTVGLEVKQLYKMLFWKNGICVIKALLIGVPLPLCFNYLHYIPMQGMLPWMIDWNLILFTVFLLGFSTILIIQYHIVKLRHINMIEVIRES